MKKLIEKQAVIDALLAKMDTIDDKPEVVLGLAVAAGMIKDMPSVTPAENPNKWICAEVLDKISAEIADIYCGQYCENPLTADAVREMALEIIDKYKAESEVQDADRD